MKGKELLLLVEHLSSETERINFYFTLNNILRWITYSVCHIQMLVLSLLTFHRQTWKAMGRRTQLSLPLYTSSKASGLIPWSSGIHTILLWSNIRTQCTSQYSVPNNVQCKQHCWCEYRPKGWCKLCETAFL